MGSHKDQELWKFEGEKHGQLNMTSLKLTDHFENQIGGMQNELVVKASQQNEKEEGPHSKQGMYTEGTTNGNSIGEHS